MEEDFKGYCLCGCIKYMLENNIINNVDTLVGSSVGALCTLLVSLDYNVNEIEKLILSFDFNKYENMTLENMIILQRILVLIMEKNSHKLLKILYLKTNNCYITFKQLYDIFKI